MEGITRKFSDLPEAIREWLASSRLTYTIIDMNRRLGIREEREIIIPQLINGLVMGEVDPRSFVTEISHRLRLSQSSAKIVAKEIEEKILHPIERDLKDELGIDVGLLHFPSGEIENGRNREIENLRTGEIENLKTEEMGRLEPVVPPNNGPLIIHAEKEEVKPPVLPPRPTFSIRIPLNQKKYTPPAPIKARIETGESENWKNREPENLKTEEMRRPKSAMPPLGPLSSISAIRQDNASPTLILPLRKGEEMGADPFVKKVVNYYRKQENEELEN